jgi:subtilisin family serine protease
VLTAAAVVLAAAAPSALAPSPAVAATGADAGSDAGLDGGASPPSLADLADLTDDRILVRWAEGIDATARRAILAVDVPELAGPPTRLSERVELLTLTGGDASDVARRLARSPGVELAEVDRVLTTAGPLTTSAIGPSTTPTDPLFVHQWGLSNIGQTLTLSGGSIVARSGFDIRLIPAWSLTRGRPDVVVAVIDTAVDGTHPDLVGAVTRQVDTSPMAAASSRFHGTAVASVIAARDDGDGMVGVAPRVSVLSIAAFTSAGDGPGNSTLADVLSAFEAARTSGAHVINASWVTPEDSPLLKAAVADARVPVVAASGNNGLSNPTAPLYPAGYDLPNLITVTAVDAGGRVPGFANIGANAVDVGAPGRTVVAAVPDGEHTFVDGTSFAAPHVAGAIALARSVAPYATPFELVDTVTRTSRVEASLVGVTRSGGMLDVDALVRGIQRPVCRRDRLAPSGFPDVERTNAHIAGIDCIVAAGLTAGRSDGTFGPADTVTRAQMASFIAAILDDVIDLPRAPSAGFVDVSPSSTHAAAIDRLADLGIALGTSDGRFRPNDPVTRAQLATFLVKTYDLLSQQTTPPTRRWFEDTATSTHVAAVDRARDLGLVRGVARVRFDPGAPTRRDQMASLLAQTLDALVRGGVDVG